MITSLITPMVFMETYKIGKIILTTILGVRVVVLSYKAWNGLDAETYGKKTGEMTLYVAMYYCLPLIKNIIKTL